MRRGYPALVAALVALGLFAGGVASATAETEPAEPPMSDVPVSVVIPDLRPSTTPTPSASTAPSSPGGGATTPPVTPPAAVTCTPTGGDTAPTASAQPSEDAGVLSLDLETVVANEWLVATASGYTPGEQVQVVVYSEAVVVDSYKADAAGNLTARFRVPEETRPGDHVAEATGWASCTANSAAFVVVTDAVAGSIPYLWWVLGVVGVLLAALAATAFYFRSSIRGWFSGGMTPAGSTQ